MTHYVTHIFQSFVVIACLCFSFTGIYIIFSGDSKGWLVLIFFGACALFLIHDFWEQYRSRKERLGGMSEKEFKDSVEREEKKEMDTIELVTEFSFQLREGEPEPPWLRFPGYSPFHIFWRMGPGESYIVKTFGPYMSELNLEQRRDYFQRYDLGDKWRDRKHWYNSWIDWEEE